MKAAAMTTMIAGPRTVVWGCVSPVQRLDERSDASHTVVEIQLDWRTPETREY
jgi:hypothetical protein